MQNQTVTQNLKSRNLSFQQSSKRQTTLSLFDETDLQLTELKRHSIKQDIKVYAIRSAIKQLLNKIQILRHSKEDEFGKFIFLKCEKGIFSWTYENWLDTLPTRSVWYQKLHREMEPHQFELWMTSRNYKALEEAIENMTKAYSDAEQTPMNVVNSIVKLNNLEIELKEEIGRGGVVTDDTIKKLQTITYVKKGWTKLSSKRAENSLILQIIKNRYKLRYSKVKEEEAELRTQQAENRLMSEIARYKKLLSTENFASSCTRDMYFNQIANLRLRLEKFQERYDREYARLDNNCSRLKLGIEKIGVSFAYLMEHLDWYKRMVETPEADYSRTSSKSQTARKIRQLRLSPRERIPLLLSTASSSILANKKGKLVPRTRTRAKKTRSLKSKETIDEYVEKQDDYIEGQYAINEKEN